MRNHNCLIIATGLIAFTASLFAQEWRWEADPTFLNPRLDSDLVQRIPRLWDDDPGLEIPGYATCMCDLSGDGTLEYVIAVGDDQSQLFLAEQTGDFPAITWRLREGFFDGLELDFPIVAVVAYDLDGNGSLELIFNDCRVIENQGDYEHPRWRRADDLFPDVNFENGYCTPHFCDFDENGQLDLVFGYDNGYVRYEQDDEGQWQRIGYTEVCHGWAYTFHLGDMDGDGDLDVIGFYDMPCRWRTGLVTFNIGTPAEPEWGESVSLDYYFGNLNNPVPCELNGDGCADIVDGWRYVLHTGEEGEAEWEKPVYWGGLTISGLTEIYDFDEDRELEIISGLYHYSGGDESHWRLAQYDLTDAGWQDVMFFGDECNLLEPPYHWSTKLAAVDIFNAGQPCLVVYSRNQIFVFEDIDQGEDFNWQLVEGFFDDLDNQFTPSFGDLDGDSDPDLVMYNEGLIEFYRFSLNGRDPSWELQEDWGEGLDSVSLTAVELADMDGDGDLDLVGAGSMNDEPAVALLFQNTGTRESPEWRHVPDAFADGGPEAAAMIKIADMNDDGWNDLITENRSYLNHTPASVPTIPLLPKVFELAAFPNPFNSNVTMTYILPVSGGVKLTIFSLCGREKTLISEGFRRVGRYAVNIDASDWPSGVYMGRLKSGGEVTTTKLVCVK